MADRGRWAPNLVAALVLISLAAALLLWQRPWDAVPSAPTYPADAAQVLASQLSALEQSDDRAAFVAAAGGPTGVGARVWDAMRILGVEADTWRYVRGGEAPDDDDGSALAIVRVTARTSTHSVFGQGESAATVGLRVRPGGDRFVISGAEVVADPLPVWLVGRVSVEPGPEARVIRIDDGGSRLLDRQLAVAADAVREAGPQLRRSLLVVSPRTAGQAAALLGRRTSQIAAIAAVTTRLGREATSPMAIVLNPVQFIAMDAHAQQVVLSHEATHQMTDAVARGGPAWVLEGFADWVALAGDDRPVEQNARQGIAAVAQHGPPAALPAAAAFASSTHGLGALYEETWLIFVVLERAHGAARVVDFYDDVLDGVPLGQALADEFGSTQVEVTAQWQAYLTDLAAASNP